MLSRKNWFNSYILTNEEKDRLHQTKQFYVKNKASITVLLILTILLFGCARQPVAIRVAGQTPSATEAPPISESLTVEENVSPAEPVDLNVFAAASLTAAFEEIGQSFESAHPGVTVVLNFASSQQLAQQINEGAPADVFASANNSQMKVVVDAGGIDADTQQTFVKNRLVVIYPKDNPGNLGELIDLARPGLKLVLAAREVPVGQYSLDFLDKAAADPGFGAAYIEDVLKNVVSFEENGRVVLTKVVLGEADAGIVYSSDVTGEDAEKVNRIDIPDALNVIASYAIAPVKESKQPELAQAFVDLVLSLDGQTILAKYGLIPAVTQNLGGAAELFTITDALGREVTFQQPPQRIVATGKALITISHRLSGN